MIKSIKKALAALDFVVESSRDSEGATLGSIATALGERTTTVRNILKTMEGCGYLARMERLYIPGAKVAGMRVGAASRNLKKVAVPILDAAAQKTGEAMVLATVVNGHREVLSRHAGSHAIGINAGTAEREPVYELVTTRIMLAYMEEASRARFFEVNGVPGREWPEALGARREAHLRDLRTAGYALRTNEHIHAGAVPVLSLEGSLLGAVGAYAPAFRMNDRLKSQLKATLLETTTLIREGLYA